MKPFEPISVPNPNKDPEFGSQSSPSRDPALDPALLDPDLAAEADGPRFELHIEDAEEELKEKKEVEMELKEKEDAETELKEKEEAETELKEKEQDEIEVNEEAWKELDENDEAWKELDENEEAWKELNENEDAWKKLNENEESEKELNENEKAEGDFGEGEEENGWGLSDGDEDGKTAYEYVNENQKFGGAGDWVDREGERSERNYQYPVRPDAEDCAFYLKNGTCKFGSNCKFNHPVRRTNQVVKERVKDKEDSAVQSNLTECKYYLKTGGCKFGKACRYNHPRSKPSVAPILELNFLGLPVRPDEKECPYYMRTGSCKYGANCKYNHPDPTTVGESDPSSGSGNGVSQSLHGVSQSPSWSSPRTLNEAVPFVPVIISPPLAVPPQNLEWNGYQAPIYPSERSMLPHAAFVMNNTATDPNLYMHQQQHMPVEEFPERPGQPECSFFLKTGDCKFKSNCKYHHPKNRNTKSPSCTLSDKGLPLRPDQNVCTHYSRYGICKFGPACKFDHPVNSSAGRQPQFRNSEMVVGGSGNTTSIPQSV